MLPYQFIFSEGYNLNIGQHVFPAHKYHYLHDRLLASGFAEAGDFVEPEPATDADMLLAHDAEWVSKLRKGTLSFEDILQLEIPYSPQMVNAFWLATGGTILACRLALRTGTGFNIGGGFHHAYAGHGEGFCAINDIAVAVRRIQHDGAIRRAMVVDCDVHHGNGTAAIFANDSSVFTLSIHQFNNYPSDKPPSDLDIHLEDGTGDAEYLERLSNGYRASLSMFQPELVIYVAGADPYEKDQLGGLRLTVEGLKARDELVLGSLRKSRIPVAIVLAGGYALNTEDTITIHANTAQVARDVMGSTLG